MLPTPSVYGVVCINCREGIRLITIPPGEPRFERAAKIFLTCPRCKTRHGYSTAGIVLLGPDESGPSPGGEEVTGA